MTDGEYPSAENQKAAAASRPYLKERPPACDEHQKAYDSKFRAGKEIIATEFRTRSALKQHYVWKPPMITEIDIPARVVNGVMIPAHRELGIMKPGQWVRTENLVQTNERAVLRSSRY